jgi:hypothetical protein
MKQEPKILDDLKGKYPNEIVYRHYDRAIEDVRAMLMKRMKELEGLLIFAREEGKNFLYEKKDIDYFKGQVNELRRIAGKVKA